MWRQSVERFCDKIQQIARYEDEANIPYDEQITHWWGDLALYALNLDVTEEQFNETYAKAVQYFKDKEAQA